MTTNKKTNKNSREEKLEQQRNLDLPINKFLNSRTEEGKFKYPVAKKLREYFINNPDPVLADIRLCNALLHELRWRQSQGKKYLENYHTSGEITMRDKNGGTMTKEDCYLAYISEKQNEHLVLSKLRELLTTRLLNKCDDVILTFDDYNTFVMQISKKVEDLGHELFPTKVKIIHPL